MRPVRSWQSMWTRATRCLVFSPNRSSWNRLSGKWRAIGKTIRSCNPRWRHRVVTPRNASRGRRLCRKLSGFRRFRQIISSQAYLSADLTCWNIARNRQKRQTGTTWKIPIDFTSSDNYNPTLISQMCRIYLGTPMAESIYISVVVPLYNEEGVVEELYRRLTEELVRIGKSYEIVFVDDGLCSGTTAGSIRIDAPATPVGNIAGDSLCQR